MGELFSALTKQVLGVFLLSAGLPAIALVLGVRALIIPAMPLTWSSLLDPELFEAEWQMALLVVAILVIAAILAGLNGPITRLYEGYPLRHSWLGRRMRSRHEALVVDADDWWHGTRTILRKVNRLRAEQRSLAGLFDDGSIDELSRKWNLAGQSMPLWSAVGGHMMFGRMATYPPIAYSDGKPPSSDGPMRPTVGDEEEGDARTQQR